jgi:hypothetical protein
MATTTTNFGWDIPQSTDLVKDGATAIAALGQDIDTAFVDFKGGTTGQVLKKTSATDLDVEWGTASAGLTLIGTTSFSSVASQTFTGLSSSYDNYIFYYALTNSTSGAELQLQFSLSGTASSTGYYMAGTTLTVGGSSGTILRNNGSTIRLNGDLSANWRIGGFLSMQNVSNAVSSSYQFAGNWVTDLANGSAQGQGAHTVATAYNEIKLISSSGNMTGYGALYGYAE